MWGTTVVWRNPPSYRLFHLLELFSLIFSQTSFSMFWSWRPKRHVLWCDAVLKLLCNTKKILCSCVANSMLDYICLKSFVIRRKFFVSRSNRMQCEDACFRRRLMTGGEFDQSDRCGLWLVSTLFHLFLISTKLDWLPVVWLASHFVKKLTLPYDPLCNQTFFLLSMV